MSDTLTATQRQRFPTLAHYLSVLPQGLDSYPQYVAKASLLRSILDDHPLTQFASELPRALVDLAVRPPPLSAWVSEVHFHAITRVVSDLHFRERSQFVAWSYEAQKRLLSSPLYSLLFAVISPERGLMLAHSRWETFHRGITLRVERMPGQSRVIYGFPPHLFDEFDLGPTLEGLRAAFELMGAKSIQIFDQQVTPTSARATFSWR